MDILFRMTMALITIFGNLKLMYHTWALRDVRSNRRSLFTLVISPYERIPDVIGKLGRWIDMYNMRADVCAVEAIRLAQAKLMNYERVPENGLIIYAGNVYTRYGARVVAIGFEPFKLIYARSNRILDRFDIGPLTNLLEPDNIGPQAVGWVRNVVKIFARSIVVLVGKSSVLLLLLVLAAYNLQDDVWVWKVITEALLWVLFVQPLVVLVVESFVLLLEDLVLLVAYNVQDHGWVQIVITQALRWFLTFVQILKVLVIDCLVQMDLVAVLVVLAAYNV